MLYELIVLIIANGHNGPTNRRELGMHETLQQCEAAGREERLKYSNTVAVYRPWDFKIMCMPADRPRLWKSADKSAPRSVYKLTISIMNRQPGEPKVHDQLLTTFDTLQACEAATRPAWAKLAAIDATYASRAIVACTETIDFSAPAAAPELRQEPFTGRAPNRIKGQPPANKV